MFINRNSYLSIIAMALIHCICFSVMAEPAHKTYPLSPDDPEAQIDASYFDIPAIVPPSPDQWGKAPRRKAQGLKAYDVKAGQEIEDFQDNSISFKERKKLPRQAFEPGYQGEVELYDSDAEVAIQENPTMGDDPNSDADSQDTNSAIVPESVCGTDNRAKINPATSYPWRTHCKIYITFPDGARFVGSATMIGPKKAITAGHCVHDKSHGGWAKSIEVIPGFSCGTKSYGSAWATYYLSWTGWTNYKDPSHDMGIICLDRTIGNAVGWLGYGYWSSLSGVTAHISGYPADRDGGLCQYYHYGGLSSLTTSYRIYYEIDTYGGQSGSGAYQIISGNRYVIGAHAYGPCPNSATRITSSKFSSIQGFCN